MFKPLFWGHVQHRWRMHFPKQKMMTYQSAKWCVLTIFCLKCFHILKKNLKLNFSHLIWKLVCHLDNLRQCLSLNQIYLVTLRPRQLTQASFLQKNQMLQNVFLIFVTLRWHSSVENHEIWTFKVNFLCQKTSESF